MKIQGATLLVTGANRGLGRSLVLAALAAIHTPPPVGALS
jgi:NAD(P)-dependent dehydrogenase (short-subunit alcohol dehydrogenase family)